jgi:predicted nucleotide-binding protein
VSVINDAVGDWGKMARKKVTQPPEPPARPLLVEPREGARRKLQNQIDKGKALVGREIQTKEELEAGREEYYRWDDFNYELLRSLFTTDEFARSYRSGFGGGVFHRLLLEQVEDFRKDVRYRVNRIESVRDLLGVISEAPTTTHSMTVSEGRDPRSDRRVFVVHGHDDLAKQSVARFIERLGLEAIILHEQANLGKTIIEKFEAYADVGYAVILLTPDDVGASKVDSQAGQALSDRARQNVVFEHGFFIGKLKRHRVCALHKGVEIPSDLQGVIYVPFDDAGKWRFDLAKEMKASGMDVDLNNAI